MHIHLTGFRWKLPGPITVPELCEQLKAHQAKQTKFLGYQRVFFLGESPGRLMGVMLTIKTQKKIPLMDVKSHQISVQTLQAGTQIIDFNFFIVNMASGKGIYSYYHHSCGVMVFNQFIGRYHDQHREALKQKALLDLGHKGETKSKQEIKAKYKGTMEGSQLIRQEELPALLAKLAKIRAFEFNADSLFVRNKFLQPLDGKLQSRKLRLTFAPNLEIGSLGQRIVDVVTNQKIKEGRIEGEDSDKVRQVIDLLETPDSFGHFLFDDVVENGMINYSHIEKSAFLGTMEEMMNKNSVHFGPSP